MLDQQHLDIRTITMGISLLDCADPDIHACAEKIYQKITRLAKHLVQTGRDIQSEFGIPIVNKRISVTPIALVAAACQAEDYTPLAVALERAAGELQVDFIGGFSALVHKGMTPSDRRLIDSLPSALAKTQHICSSINVATTRAGINMDAVALMGQRIKEIAQATADADSIGCAKLTVFANAVEDNPFMAGRVPRRGRGGAGHQRRRVRAGRRVPRPAERLRARRLTRWPRRSKRRPSASRAWGSSSRRRQSRRLGVPFGVVDLSLALRRPPVGDSVARILEEMGLEACGTHGTTAALALLNDAVKKGGVMASSSCRRAVRRVHPGARRTRA